MKRFAVDVLRILKSKSMVKEIHFNEFPVAFSKICGRPFAAEDYGLCSLRDLMKDLLRRTALVAAIIENGVDLVGVKLV